MIRFLWISPCLWLVAAETCDVKLLQPESKFSCGQVEPPNYDELINKCINANQSISCIYSFEYDVIDKQWNPLPAQMGIEDDKSWCKHDNQNFSMGCKESNCSIDLNTAFYKCFHSKTEITCDNKTHTVGKTPKKGMKLGCLLTIDASDGTLKPTVEAKLMENRTACYHYVNDSRMDLRCFDDDCDAQFDIAYENITKYACKVHYLQCGAKHHINNYTIYPQCLYSWIRDGNKFVSEFDEPEFTKTKVSYSNCIHYDGETITVACEADCGNLTLEDTKSDKYCAGLIASNLHGRKTLMVSFPIISVLIVAAVLYGGGRALCKARRAHSLLLEEYQAEFGTKQKGGSTSGSKKQGKKKRREATEDTTGNMDKKEKVKKPKSDPPPS